MLPPPRQLAPKRSLLDGQGKEKGGGRRGRRRRRTRTRTRTRTVPPLLQRLAPRRAEISFRDDARKKSVKQLVPVPNGLILHVAEKPSIATSIAKALSRGTHKTEKRGMCATHAFSTSHLAFPGSPKAQDSLTIRHRVTSVVGHVFSVDFGKEYQSWDSVKSC